MINGINGHFLVAAIFLLMIAKLAGMAMLRERKTRTVGAAILAASTSFSGIVLLVLLTAS